MVRMKTKHRLEGAEQNGKATFKKFAVKEAKKQGGN